MIGILIVLILNLPYFLIMTSQIYRKEMVIFTRTFDFLSWLLPATNHFPAPSVTPLPNAFSILPLTYENV